jgi:hypothetical protein
MRRVSLAYKGPNCLTDSLLAEIRDSVVELDLSWNAIGNLLVLRDLTKVKRLLICHNDELTSTTNFPRLPSVELLWVNFCRIDNLAVFVDKLSTAFPNLRFLSMFGNEACRNVLNGGSLAEYKDYRRFVIARLPMLVALEDRVITIEERDKAREKYGGATSKQGLSKVLGKQKKSRSKKVAARKSEVVTAEPEHPYARKVHEKLAIMLVLKQKKKQKHRTNCQFLGRASILKMNGRQTVNQSIIGKDIPSSLECFCL